MKPTLAIAALTILVFAVLALVLRYFKQTPGRAQMSEPATPLAPASDAPVTNSPTPDSFDAKYWVQMNEWHFKDQADDRRPMFGSIAKGTGRASSHRADARHSLQVMFKEWSKSRHD
jgi:hypothetical protein